MPEMKVSRSACVLPGPAAPAHFLYLMRGWVGEWGGRGGGGRWLDNGGGPWLSYSHRRCWGEKQQSVVTTPPSAPVRAEHDDGASRNCAIFCLPGEDVFGRRVVARRFVRNVDDNQRAYSVGRRDVGDRRAEGVPVCGRVELRAVLVGLELVAGGDEAVSFVRERVTLPDVTLHLTPRLGAHGGTHAEALELWREGGGSGLAILALASQELTVGWKGSNAWVKSTYLASTRREWYASQSACSAADVEEGREESRRGRRNGALTNMARAGGGGL